MASAWVQPDSQQRNIKSVRAARVQKKGSLFDADDDLGAEESDVKIGDLMVTSLLEYEKPSDAELLSNRPSTGAAASDIDALLADDDNVGAKSTASKLTMLLDRYRWGTCSEVLQLSGLLEAA